MSVPRGKTTLILAGIGIVAAAVAAGYLLGFPGVTGTAGAGPGSAGTEAEAASPGFMYLLKERVVNLSDPGGRRYLKVAMSIEFTAGAADLRRASHEERRNRQAEFEKSISPQVPLIEDAIIGLLTAKSSTDVASPEGKLQLKNEIKDRLNHLLGGEQVSNVYFTQFLMQ